jgi:Clp amino terminal domain, pathogenicity island component
MYPFERFSEPAKKVLTLAQEEAERSHHSYIGTEHLLLGLLRNEECLAHAALEALDVGVEETRQRIEEILGRNQRIIIQQIIPTSRVKKVIEIAFEEAQRSGQTSVGTQFLLFGLLVEGEGVAAKVLEKQGVTIEAARAEVERLVGEGAAEGMAAHPGPVGVPPPPMLPEMRRLMLRAQMEARVKGLAGFGLRHLLDAILASPAGVEVLARSLDLRRIVATKEQAITAADFEAAAAYGTEEQRARQALEEALVAWREELEPPAGSP